MTSIPALAEFQQARTAEACRVSLRGGLAEAGRAACQRLTAALDRALVELAAPLSGTGLAVVAVGGYGRREQARHSDVDLMLLVEREPATEAVHAVLYPLWDAGLKVGHSVRTPTQAMHAAEERVETFTALLDARLVAGDRLLFTHLTADLDRQIGRHRDWMLRELAAGRRERIAREPWQLQAPDLKAGRGGLRDVQAIHWRSLADTRAGGEAPSAPDEALSAAHQVLLATRNALHCLGDRPNDRFRPDLAPAVAELLGVDHATWMHTLLDAMRTVDALAASRLLAPPAAHRQWWSGWLPRRGGPRTAAVASGESDFERLMAALGALGESGETGPAEPVMTQAPPLDPLPRSEWLARVLPEWEALRSLPHVAPVHMHPVDTHSARTVAELLRAVDEDADATHTPGVAAALGGSESRAELMLAALLHDIGKGHEGDHSAVGAVIAERVASRIGLDAETTRRLVRVVEHHLLLPTVAVRRDIADAQVIEETAALAGDARTLHLLYLLAVADARATGPDVWSAWKAQLLRALYLRVLDRLSEGEERVTPTERQRALVLTMLAGRFPVGDVERHLDQLPASYLLSTPPEVIGTHLELVAAARRDPARSAVIHDRIDELDRLTLVTPDRPGLLSLMAGTLAAHSVSVLGGVAYTRDDGLALDVYHVADALGRGLDERRWARVIEAVPQALAGQFPIEQRLSATRRTYAGVVPPGERFRDIPTTVHVDNHGSRQYTIIEVTATDRIGLLYTITSALHEIALDIHLAKVDTLGREVVDAFYVLRENGRRVDEPDQIERLKQHVIEAVAALDGGEPA